MASVEVESAPVAPVETTPAEVEVTPAPEVNKAEEPAPAVEKDVEVESAPAPEEAAPAAEE
ncbi:hypothetical protein D1645_27580, partial [Parabacteroides goldsteinii]|nr:hypothetical protein [Parabacteroides goldsteinii]